MGTCSLRARGFRVLGRAEGVGKAGIRSTQTFVSGNPITKSSPSLNSSKNAQGSSMPVQISSLVQGFLLQNAHFEPLSDKMEVPYFGVLIIRILPFRAFRVLYWGPLFSQLPPRALVSSPHLSLTDSPTCSVPEHTL